jgi:hypothetical protein
MKQKKKDHLMAGSNQKLNFDCYGVYNIQAQSVVDRRGRHVGSNMGFLSLTIMSPKINLRFHVLP